MRAVPLIVANSAAAAGDIMAADAFAAGWHGATFGAAAVARARSPETVMKLQLMPDKGLNGMGAVCLDGTNAGFFFAPASSPRNRNDWQLYFQGGGWCYDKEDCWGRSSTLLGSSRNWQRQVSFGGIMSDNCTQNPDFCNFNRVHFCYCDGNSFSGNREHPVVVNGKRFAGGLAAYLHADYVHQRLREIAPNMRRFRVAPISGFFLLHNTLEGKPVYPSEMRNIFGLANATHGVNDKCIAAMPVGDEWRCNFAEEAYKYTSLPVFPINSALDAWQTVCIYAAELPPGFPNQTGTANGACNAVPGYKACGHNPENCTAVQIGVMNKYIADFTTTLQNASTYRAAGNGAFIHSCHTHCEAQGGAFNAIKIGGVSMQQAVSR
eukprot:gene231-1376_t